jgi:aminopeptidase-like protein
MRTFEKAMLSSPEIVTELEAAGAAMHDLIRRLYPICRSITGNGVRETLKIVRQEIPINVHEVPTGTPVFDWKVPNEWNIRDAYIKDSKGKRVVDFAECNLHVVNYSVPVHTRMRLQELKNHLYTIPEHPDWIPYRTSYYKQDWGFCLTHRQLLELPDDEYEVCIDSSLAEGQLTYGELYIPGEISDEVLISTHVCHPSLCNDNLSGIALNVFLAKRIAVQSHRYSYRFLFIPGTIGAITWLAVNESNVSKIKHGLVLASAGDAGKITYKKTRHGSAEVDRAVQHVLRWSGEQYGVLEFSPYGYDERQFSSPGFNLAVGSISRTPHSQFPEYHTSADNLDFVKPESLADSLTKCLSFLHVIDHNKTFMNQNPKCEPQLGRRGLFRAFGGRAETKASELAMLWILNLSDGKHTLLDIAERADLQFSLIKETADVLEQHGLLKAT